MRSFNYESYKSEIYRRNRKKRLKTNRNTKYMSYNLDSNQNNQNNQNKNNKSSTFNISKTSTVLKKYNDPSIGYKERMSHLNTEIDATFNKLRKLEQLKQLRLLKYKDYLNTPYFKAFRERVLKSRKYTCERCKAKYGLQVHHKHYGSLGNERLDDVMLLCFHCHERIHKVV